MMTSESQITPQLPMPKHGMRDHAQPVGQAFGLGGADVTRIPCTIAAHHFVQHLESGIACQSNMQ